MAVPVGAAPQKSIERAALAARSFHLLQPCGLSGHAIRWQGAPNLARHDIVGQAIDGGPAPVRCFESAPTPAATALAPSVTVIRRIGRAVGARVGRAVRTRVRGTVG